MIQPPAIVRPVMEMTQAEQAAQKAWLALKSSAKKDRGHWLSIGQGLLEIREKYPSDELYGKRLKELGLDDISPRTRTDAVWLAENIDTVTEIISESISNPEVIRKEYREYEKRLADLEAEAKSKAEREEAALIAAIKPKDATKYIKLEATLKDEASAPAEKEKATQQIKKIVGNYSVSQDIIRKAAERQKKREETISRFEKERGAPMNEPDPAAYRRKVLEERFKSILKKHVPATEIDEIVTQLIEAIQ